MSEVVAPPGLCAQCGATLFPPDLACPVCGQLVHLQRLRVLSEQAQQIEAIDPRAAAGIWRQCINLLPPASPQAAMLSQRITALENLRPPFPPAAPPRPRISNPLIRTGGSMLVSILVYAYFFGWAFSAGFVLLIWVHEMGHVLALRRYGVRATSPLFLPFVGAVISVYRLRDAAQEAIMAIAGPVTGTLGAVGALVLWHYLHDPVLLEVAFIAFAMNLMNLLPIPPLDGGRVTAAVSPWIWPIGFLVLLAVVVQQFYQAIRGGIWFSPVPLLILYFSFRRVWSTLRSGYRDDPYYRIPRKTSLAIGAAYLLLAVFLVAMLALTRQLGADLPV
jgi:Zn-dependent protease